MAGVVPEASAGLVVATVRDDFEFPDAAFREVNRKAISSHGKTIAAASSTIIHREKIKWTAGRCAWSDRAGISSSKSVDKTLFPSMQPA